MAGHPNTGAWARRARTDAALRRRRALLLGSLGVALYVLWLGRRTLWYPGEPDLAEVCRAMVVRAAWIVPLRNGTVYLNYPPLHYWMGAFSSWLLGGMSDFSLRLPGALAAIGLLLTTCAAASRWLGRRTGLWAGLLLITSSQYSFQAIQYRPDMLFAFFAATGILVYARGVETPGPGRLAWRVGGFALLGIAMLAKGPLGLGLPGLVLALWHLVRRDRRHLLELVPLAGVALAVALPWYVACAREIGVQPLWASLVGENVGRFASGEEGHGRPFFYYLVDFWVDFAPWSLLFPFALAWIARGRRWRDPAIALALVWFATFLVVLSVAATKRQAYLLPAYPAVTLLLGHWLASLSVQPDVADAGDAPGRRAARLFATASSWLLGGAGVAAALGAAALGPIVERAAPNESLRSALLDLRLPLVALALAAGIGWLWLRRAVREGDLPASLLRVALAQALVFLVVIAGVLPALDPTNTYEAPLRLVGEQLGGSTRVGFLGSDRKVGAVGYYTGALVERVHDTAEIESFFRRNPASLVIVDEHEADDRIAVSSPRWHDRIVREFDAARRHYLVLRGAE